jgi:hypothetical protein
MSLTVHVPNQAGRPALETHRTRLASLFPTSVYTRLGPRRLALGLLAIAVGAAVCLLRVSGTGPLQSIWEEDARDILDGALNTNGWGAVFRPVAGYFVVGPRLLGEFATLFPLSWAAAVLSISAAVITAALALLVYSASAPFFPSPVAGRIARAAVSLPVLFAPVAENRFNEVYDRPVCLHFFAVYAMFWVLVWSPATNRGRVAALVTTVLTGLSTILIVGLLPLAALRLVARRDRYGIALVALVGGGALTQAIGVWTGVAQRVGDTVTMDPYWVLRTFAGWGVPTSMLGFRATRGITGVDVWGGVAHEPGPVIAAWLIVAAVVAASVVGARTGWLRPRWTLAAAAGASSLLMYAMTAVASGITYRYLIPVSLLLIAAAVALLYPADTRAATRPIARAARSSALAGLVVGVLVAAAFNYRWTDTYRSHAPQWTNQVQLAAQACRHDPRLDEVIVRGAPLPWWSIVRVSCHDLLPLPPACSAPQCQWLDPPVSIGAQRGRYDR